MALRAFFGGQHSFWLWQELRYSPWCVAANHGVEVFY